MKGIAAIAVVVLAACSTSAPAAAPNDTRPPITPVAPTVPTGTPCEQSAQQLVNYIEGPLDGTVTNDQYGHTHFHELLNTSLGLCGTLEWDETMNSLLIDSGTAIASTHRKGCAVARFLSDATGDPLPAACV